MDRGTVVLQSHAIESIGENTRAWIALTLHLNHAGHEADDVGE